ncbi:hypothetical protein BsWGS_07062 [Bradybaena similaris]
MYAFALLVVLPALMVAVPPPNLADNLFKVLDPSGDGKISKTEAETYFLSYDTNKDGKITLAEFSANVDKVDLSFAGHETALYGLLDSTGDGGVTKSELDVVFNLVDKDSNNIIDRPEFDAAFAAVVSHVG